MSPIPRVRRSSPALLAALPLLLCLANGARGEPANDTWIGEAGSTSRVVTTAGTSALRAGTGVVASCKGPEFRLCIGEKPVTLSSADYRASLTKESTEAVCTWISARHAPTVTARYVVDPQASVVRKSLTITNRGPRPMLLRWVEVESLNPGEPVTYAVARNFPSVGDWGQPVFTKHFFFAIEFPAARCTALSDGSLQMREYPGVWLKPGESWQSHPAVVGSSPSGDVEETFLGYVARLSRRPLRAFIYWDGFRVIMPPNRTEKGLKMVERARELKKLTGFQFDAWTYDAGFNMYRPDGLWIPSEPDLWPKTRAALKDVGTPLGFWTSFSCIFDTFTQPWGAKQGYGLQNPHAYCLAEPKYAQAMEDRLVQIVHDNGMRSINFDGMMWGQGFGCNTAGHGHLVGSGAERGVYGTYAVAANEMRIFERLRRERPDICLDMFVCDEWASPFWLSVVDGVHTVPGDTVAAGIPSPWLRDELITVRDMQVWKLHKELKRKFPLYAEDLYGVQVRSDHLIDDIAVTGEDYTARWEDEYVMSLAARGTVSAYVVCTDLDVLAGSTSGLRFLGDVGKWVRANAEIYRHFALLGGDPAKQQAFGYVHGDGRGRAIVGLRNPSIRTQQFDLKVAPQFNLGQPGPYQVTMVYPYRYTWPKLEAGQTLPITLADFEVALLEIRCGDRQFAGLPEGRWRDEDGTIAVAGPDAEPPVPAVQLHLTEPGKPAIGGRIVIPDGVQGELQVSVAPPRGTKKIAAIATLDGQPVTVQTHFRNRGNSQDGWILMPIASGTHDVSISIQCGMPTRLDGWLQYRVAPSFRRTSQRSPEGLFPALNGNELRRTCPAHPAAAFAGPKGPSN